MNGGVKILLITLMVMTNLNCHITKQLGYKSKRLYKSSQLMINQISENAFIHVSYKQTTDFGYVPCNGLIVRDQHEVIVFDTPTNDTSARELITWIQEQLHCKINAVIPTHFHDDCLGGLNMFHEYHIPSYANQQTIQLADEHHMTLPKNGFKDSLTLNVGKQIINVRYFGEGHTKDNVVGYFPGEQIMFGGCLIKELNAGKGYLGDANTAIWSNTVEHVKQTYPDVKIVVPGHGNYGNRELLEYTIRLFKTE